MFVSYDRTMNDATVRNHLRKKLDSIARDVKMYFQDIDGLHRTIEDKLDRIRLLKVEYTSFLNTALAYGLTEEQMENDGYAMLEDDDVCG